MKYLYRLCYLLVLLCVYLGCGMLLHTVLVGEQVDFSSSLSIGVIVAWPMILLVTLGLITLSILILIFLIALLVAVLEKIGLLARAGKWRLDRVMRRIVKDR